MALGFFFADTEPKKEPKPILVGGHLGYGYTECEMKRALIDGYPIQIVLPESSLKVSPSRPRFGADKCEHADALGRWLNLGSNDCAPPYCTGNRKATVNEMDWVREWELTHFTVKYPLLILIDVIVPCACRMVAKVAVGFGCHTRATITCTRVRTSTPALLRRM